MRSRTAQQCPAVLCLRRQTQPAASAVFSLAIAARPVAAGWVGLRTLTARPRQAAPRRHLLRAQSAARAATISPRPTTAVLPVAPTLPAQLPQAALVSLVLMRRRPAGREGARNLVLMAPQVREATQTPAVVRFPVVRAGI